MTTDAFQNASRVNETAPDVAANIRSLPPPKNAKTCWEKWYELWGMWILSLSLSLSHTHTHTLIYEHQRTSKMMVYSRCRQEMIPMSIASRASDSFVYHSCGVPIQQTDQVVNWHYSVRPNQIALKDGGISAPRRSLIWVYNVRKARFFHTRWAHAHSGKILLGTVVVNLKEIDIVPKGLFSPHATKNYFVCIDASFYKKNVFVKNRYATFQVSFNVSAKARQLPRKKWPLEDKENEGKGIVARTHKHSDIAAGRRPVIYEFLAGSCVCLMVTIFEGTLSLSLSLLS